MIGPEHWTSLATWKAQPIHPNDIDVSGTPRYAVTEQPSCVVNHRQQASLQYLVIGDVPSFE
ncbi:hypothetical protein, partial [Mesorhizobium sp. M1D.F.Ca.ET.183.01.1.1]|uniref:hypothetical protein n=1 Tax=Mesorhizobium sp. M1D.F.Ca.ET.183.01.1.1 TaxID=2496666 RepID=UPI001FE2102A